MREEGPVAIVALFNARKEGIRELGDMLDAIAHTLRF
jgi:hypothetical protein